MVTLAGVGVKTELLPVSMFILNTSEVNFLWSREGSDVVVIGSGIGGLTWAGLLARLLVPGIEVFEVNYMYFMS